MLRGMQCTGKRLSDNKSCTRHSLREGQVTSQIAHNALADFDKAEHTGPYCTELSRKEHIMQLGMIGLGRMGAFMAQRLIRGGHTIVGYVRHAETVEALLKGGTITKGAIMAHHQRNKTKI